MTGAIRAEAIVAVAPPRRAGPAASPLPAIRRAAAPALVALVVVNFLWAALAGPNGALRLAHYHRLGEERGAELSRLQAERAAIAHHIFLLDPRQADPDYVEERVRRDLGLVRPDEAVLAVRD